MRILLLNAEDSPRHGPWAQQRWDLIIDLGKSSEFSALKWSKQARCPILRADSFRRGVEDLRSVREIFSKGRGRLLDDEGLDWWDLTSLVIMPEAEAVLVFRRLAAEINSAAEVWASRPSWAAKVVELLIGRPIQFFSVEPYRQLLNRAEHYWNFFSRFPAGQIKEIILDRFDSGYKWRSRISSRPHALANPVVLLPSAYGNVSRMAASYAQLLPEQSFLLVATRRSAKQFEPPANVHIRDLASYAGPGAPSRETERILQEWAKLSEELRENKELEILLRSGAMDRLPGWFRDGLNARNAWCAVIEREPVNAILCGDDSNIFTRLPVLLAASRKIPTVDFHHGAMDGRYLLKDLPCDVYLAKNDMERDYLLRTCKLPSEKIAIGAPAKAQGNFYEDQQSSTKDAIVLFSEPYENVGMRCEEVYRELLPSLCRLAHHTGRRVIVKLHPFESVSIRDKIVRAILIEEDRKVVSMVDGPLSGELLSRAWFGITVESTTVIDCLLYNVPCFLCGWLTLSSFEYPQQYLRFGIGENLCRADEVPEIPRRIALFDGHSAKRPTLWKTVEPSILQQWLSPELHAESAARRVS